MQVLLAHNSLYYPSHGGGDKSNRLLMEALAARGHRVRAVARVEDFSPASHAALLSQLDRRGVTACSPDGNSLEFHLNGVEVSVLTANPYWRAYFEAQAAVFAPDVILTSTDDPALLLFGAALRVPRARVVYLARAIVATPFGPDSALPNAERTATLRAADGVVGVSEYVAGYARQYGGLEAVYAPISLLTPGEWPMLGSFDNRYITMVNPCAFKGISIFLGLAERFPALEFAAVPTWGTTRIDYQAMARQSNITVLQPVDDINDLLRHTKVVLVPSLWAEARSRMILEAMSRGIPVMAAAVGGLPEAMLGQPYLLPVAPVIAYHASLDESMVPAGGIPAQDVEPWAHALEQLTTDRAHYETLSAQCRRAALDYARGYNVEPFEAYLESLLAKPRRAPMPAAPLADERRRLLQLRLRKMRTGAVGNVDL
ncbi:MAG: glycosyltransferase family 4 protein [Bryobacterales bacterium]|nr:glycosyltransferase family 4 protein [Bryobacterales bacterium]